MSDEEVLKLAAAALAARRAYKSADRRCGSLGDELHREQRARGELMQQSERAGERLLALIYDEADRV